jgi:hypothetical protein
MNNPFKNIAAETMTQENPPEFRRTSGSVICKVCGKEYRRHPHSDDRDWNGDPFLNELCDGSLVKL